MGRPEPCVLYAHTFVHSRLDEYIDEVLFSEPVVITACEFLEQNASSLCPAVKLMGATSPPSFALEVFIQCEGETRFRRLCLPCLYSHSSSNVLEVEAMVTNHLIVRGSYRTLSMVIYGNTAEDLGQFNIEVDLDTSLTDTVSAIEGNLEDLPPAFHPNKPTIVDHPFSLEILLSQPVASPDIPLEVRQFLQLVFKIFDARSPEVVASDKILGSLLSISSNYANQTLNEAVKELLAISENVHYRDNSLAESSAESLFLESEAVVPTSRELVETLHDRFDFCGSAGNVGYPHLSQNTNTIFWLGVARLLCSKRQSCTYFVSYGGMKQLSYAFMHRVHNSTALTLLFLGVIEQATRHLIGCEGFIGWWPREDEKIPPGFSDNYNHLLKILLENQRHDVAALTTYILHRIQFYEVACRYESAVLSMLGDLSAAARVTDFTLDHLTRAKLQLKKLLKLIKLSGPIDDPSAMAVANRFFILGDGGLMTYKSTSGLIKQSNCRFLNVDIDSHLLSLLKERGFLPLSAALLSSPILQSETGRSVDSLAVLVSHFEAIILSLLFSRPGLAFLLQDHEVFLTVIGALRGTENIHKEDSISVRYASVLISKGFFCRPKEIGAVIEMHARALIALDSLIKSTPNSEQFLWVLWDLCRLSRSECGRQALLVLVNFPEALEILMTALHSGRELDPVSSNTGLSPLNLAIFHSAAEIFEVIVTDSTATSLTSWIDHAKVLHAAVHSSSPGSNMKDAPARLLEWIDAGVVYHRNGAIGLLKYAAVLASGGDAHMASNSVLASDVMDVDGDFASSGSEGNIVDNLIGKRITEKDFTGVVLRDSSVAQLTTAFRILAFISDNSVAAASLYDEGAVMVIHAILINCKLMLERSSNTYDYLVDEGIEANSTSDLLLERNREKSLFDLLIPSLVLLINLLQKLKEAKEQHRNTKLMNALLQLHREVSPKLAACASDLSHSSPDFALGFGAVCHLLASALACWPMYGWTPGLLHFLLDSLHTTSLLALGPKETCSLLCLLNDLFPDESISLWKNGIPTLSFVRALAVGTILGPQKEKQINWYQRPGHPEKLIAQLSPQLAKLGEIVLHCAISTSVVIQDILRVFIIRIARLSTDSASALLKPILSWISRCLLDPSLSSLDTYKVNQLLNFLSILLEHPNAKPLLLKEGGFQMLTKVLERCMGAVNSDSTQFPENINVTKYETSPTKWCIPAFKSIALISDGRASVHYHERKIPVNFTAEACYVSMSYVLQFCSILPVGRELLACLSAFKETGSSPAGQCALLSIFMHIRSDFYSQIKRESDTINASEWKEHPPLFECWTTLLGSIGSSDVSPVHVASGIDMLSTGALNFCMEGGSLNLERAAAIKFLFGVKDEISTDSFVEQSLKHIEELTDLLRSDESAINDTEFNESASLLLLLLQTPPTSGEVDVKIATRYTSLLTSPVLHRIEDSIPDEFASKFSWECPENLRAGLPLKRKISSDGPTSRRGPGRDNLVPDTAPQSQFSRGPVPIPTPSGPTRRDLFRQRKPNTSRPPSMHVDDYVARERNTDNTNTNNSVVISVPRIGSSSGRPPSIHVDEFMKRERQVVTQVKAAPSSSHNEVDVDKPVKQAKPVLDDDLQGIDIVFDAEESEPYDDKLPFPQPDDDLGVPAPVVVEQGSPNSIVEETESNMGENTPSEFSSRVSASRQLGREQSISSDKKFPDQSDSFPVRNPIDSSSTAVQYPYSNANIQHGGNVPLVANSQGYYDPKFQPPLPPMPPPQTVLSQNMDSTASQGYHVHSEYGSSRFGRNPHSSPGGPTRPPPPLPPTPPPYSSNSSLLKNPTSQSQQYFQTMTPNHDPTVVPSADGGVPSRSMINSYPHLMQPMLFRPNSNPYANLNSQNLPMSLPIPTLTQLQPLQPPQIPRPPAQHTPPQHLRPPASEQGSSFLKGGPQMAAQSSQATSSVPHGYYQMQPQANVQHSMQPQENVQHAMQQQQDPAMSLQDYFKSPEAIQSLLSDRNKLCQLLEQHPKLMQMLQERLGRL